jgi:hypothetical protein
VVGRQLPVWSGKTPCLEFVIDPTEMLAPTRWLVLAMIRTGTGLLQEIYFVDVS